MCRTVWGFGNRACLVTVPLAFVIIHQSSESLLCACTCMYLHMQRILATCYQKLHSLTAIETDGVMEDQQVQTLELGVLLLLRIDADRIIWALQSLNVLCVNNTVCGICNKRNIKRLETTHMEGIQLAALNKP